MMLWIPSILSTIRGNHSGILPPRDSSKKRCKNDGDLATPPHQRKIEIGLIDNINIRLNG